MKRIFTHFFTFLLLTCVTGVTAQTALTSLEAGKVYRFKSVGYSTYALNASSNTDVNAVVGDESDLRQQWYVEKEGDYYVFRNLANGGFLKGNGQSSAWSISEDCSADANKFTLFTSNTTHNTIKGYGYGNWGYMHCDGWKDIVGWSNGDTDNGTHWDIVEVSYTDDEIDALLENAPTAAEKAAFQPALDAIFTDKACTVLADAYTVAQMSDSQLLADEKYLALPRALKAMVGKIRGGDSSWNEASEISGKEWSSEYAKRFRVQMYEPYSVESEITSFLRINAHSNMDNPTGIYANAGENIYIMVDGDIADGAELWVAYRDGFGTSAYYNDSRYTQLKKGLNIVPYSVNGAQLWINYLVHTYDSSKEGDARFREISDYKPLKIHIEGGHINGFYNAIGDFRATTPEENLWGDVDNDADWNYYKERAPLNGADGRPNRDFPLLGHRQVLLFPLGDQANSDGGTEKGLLYWLDNLEVPDTPNCYGGTGNTFGTFDAQYPNMGLSATGGKINIMIEAWDRIMYSQLATMGLVNTSTIETMNALYPRWTADGKNAEIYNYGAAADGKSYLEFCEGRDYSEYFNHHGAAVGAPSGYMSGGWKLCNYHYNTMGSIIGKIATEAGPTWGPAHEIGHQHQAVFNLNGQTEVTNNFFSNVAVWYMGMGTSRVNGNEGSLESVLGAFNTENNDLYTNNIWAITHLYYRLWLYYHLAGNNTQFWPRLFELCRQIPIVNGGQISGETSLLRFYQHACNAAGEDLTEFFRAHGFFELMTDRFVGDYSNAIYNVTQAQIDAAIKTIKDKEYPENLSIIFINDGTSTTTKKHDGSTARALWDNSATAEMGSVNDFIDGNVEITSSYTATIDDNGNVIMSGGTGGVGFLVLNEKGELLSFSNKKEFALSSEAAYLVATGKATISAVDDESNTLIAAVDVVSTRFALLQELVDKVKVLTENLSETRVGYYKPSAVEHLQEYVTDAETVIADADQASLQAVYELLYNEYNAVVANEFSRVKFIPNSKYLIKNKGNNSKIMSENNDTVVTTNSESDATQWLIERDIAYRIKNVASGKYLQGVTDENGKPFTLGADAVNYNITEVATGWFAISASQTPSRYMNMNGANNAKVITWGSSGDNNSQWSFELIGDADETYEAKENLLELSKKALALVDNVAVINYIEGDKVALQCGDSNQANYIWSNAAVNGNDVDKLLDGNKDTFFHSQWGNSTAPADGWGHHITVDLGSATTLSSFKFKYTTRNDANLSNYPKAIDVYGSLDGNDYTKISSFTGLTTGKGVDNEGVVMGDGTIYRYLRFLVVDATPNNGGVNTGDDGKVFFHMSEFSLYPITISATVKDDYVSNVTTQAVLAAYRNAEEGRSVYNNASATKVVVDAKEAAVEEAYNTLLQQYNDVKDAVLEAKKATLQEWIDKTTALIASAGTVEFAKNEKVDLHGKLYAERPYTNGGTGDSDYSSQEDDYNLLDNEPSTHFHSDYHSTMPNVPYIRVDLGENDSADRFTFNYTTRSTGTGYPTTIKLYGSNSEITYDDVKNTEPLAVFTTSDAENPLPSKYDEWESNCIEATTPFRYFVFAVTSSSVTKTYNGVQKPYFVMSEFGFTKVSGTTVTITNDVVSEELLLNTSLANSKAIKLHEESTSTAMIDEAIVDIQAAYNELYAVINDISAYKTALQQLIDDTQALYDTMSLDGKVNNYYATSTLTDAYLETVAAEIAESQAVIDNAASVKEQYITATEELQEKHDALLAIENAKVTDKSSLEGVLNDMQTLLDEISEDIIVEKTSLALQTTEADADFYIWCNKPAGDSDGIVGLIDKNNDGTANTDTYLGTEWGATVPAYTHYIEVDLGEAKLADFSFDYTTRDSGYSDQRPYSIKLLGSNDKENYEEITIFSEGMPVGQRELWALSTPFVLDSVYRYLRFAVASDPGRGYFHMSDFNLYAYNAILLKDNYAAFEINNEQIIGLSTAYKNAIAAKELYVTADNYGVVLSELQQQYDALLAIKNANVTDKSELEALKNDTESLIDEVSAISTEETVIPMQCTDANAPYFLYCNAEGKTNNYDGDNTGVLALLDVNTDGTPNTGTFLHTTYYGDDYDADCAELGHYLRLDVGAGKALKVFKFNYVGRVNNTGNAPATIVVEGSNDLNNFDVITEITGLPSENNATYASGEITNGKAYRYVRFRVTATQNNSKYNGKVFFALSTFGVTACETIEVGSEYAINMKLADVVTALNKVVDATEFVGKIDGPEYVPESAYNNELDELQAAYDKLYTAKMLQGIPVTLTTDATNPVLYRIRINRGNAKVLEYDGAAGASGFVAVTDTTEYQYPYQAWYFMQGDDEASYDDIFILPYRHNGAVNTAMKLGTNNISDGIEKVKAVDGADESYKLNWYITFKEGSTAEGWWNIQPEGKGNYFSNHSGEAKKMGFYNSAGDDGSEFKFELIENKNYFCDAYYSLLDLYNECEGTVEGGSSVGDYADAAAVDAYNAAYTQAGSLLETETAPEADYSNAFTALDEAKNSLRVIMPEETSDAAPKLYVIRNAHYENSKMYASGDTVPSLYYNNDAMCSKFVFTFESAGDGKFKIKSLERGTYLSSAEGHGTETVVKIAGDADDAIPVTISRISSGSRAVSIVPDGGAMIHAASGDRVVGWNKNDASGASAWFIDEVENLSDVHFNVSMKAEYSSVMLGYPAEVPDGVEAYDAVGIDGAYVDLVPVNGVIPANTPVVLKRTDNELGVTKVYDFKYTNEAPEYSNENPSLLGGSLYVKYVACDANSNYYKLMIKTGETVARMYHMYKEFNENGVSQGSSDAGGHIKCSANKIYMCVPESNKVASYSLRVIENGVTGVDEVDSERGEDVIYDLQGRKVTEVTSPGFYIVNGKKVYVR